MHFRNLLDREEAQRRLLQSLSEIRFKTQRLGEPILSRKMDHTWCLGNPSKAALEIAKLQQAVSDLLTILPERSRDNDKAWKISNARAVLNGER